MIYGLVKKLTHDTPKNAAETDELLTFVSFFVEIK